MRHFAYIAGCGYAAKTDTEAEDESSSEEHASIDGRGLDASADDNDCCASKHANATPQIVIDRAREEHSWDRSDIIHSEH